MGRHHPEGLAATLASPRRHAFGSGRDFGIRWDTEVGPDRSSVVGTGASGNVANMLAQLSEQVTSMHVDSGSLAFYKREFVDYLSRAEELPLAKADRALDRALFPEHPLADQALAADQQRLSEGELDEWFARAWSPDNAVLVVTGDVEAAPTLAEAKRWLADWRPAENPFSRVSPPLLRGGSPTVLVTHQPNATQARVRLACLTEGQSVSQELASRTLVSLLASALFEKIRGEMGASYGFHGAATSLVSGRQRLDWEGAIENARLGDALAKVADAARDFGRLTLTDAAVERARWQVARELTLADATAPSAARLLTHQALANRDLRRPPGASPRSW